jgi:hypothetical protein
MKWRYLKLVVLTVLATPVLSSDATAGGKDLAFKFEVQVKPQDNGAKNWKSVASYKKKSDADDLKKKLDQYNLVKSRVIQK